MLDRRARELAAPFLLALALVLASLPGEAGPNGAAGALRGRPALVRAGVHVLDARTLGGLGRTEPALVFESATPELRRLSRGDVIVAGVSPSTPRGLLRRVTRVERDGGRLVVETAPGALEDLFWSARIRHRARMLPADIAVARPRVEGLAVPDAATRAWSPGPIEFELLDVVLFDADADPATTSDQVRATGTLGVEPSFDLDVDIAWGRVRRLQFTNTTRLYATLALDARAAASFGHTVTVATVQFAPVTLIIGPVPLVLTPVLDVQVGASGSVSAELRTSVTAATDVVAGLVYEDARWRGFSDLPDGLEDIDLDWSPPEATGSAGVEVQAGPQLTLLLYDIGGPYASVYGYTVAWAAPEPPTWALDVGLRGSLGVAVRTPATGELARYGVEVFDQSWRVAGDPASRERDATSRKAPRTPRRAAPTRTSARRAAGARAPVVPTTSTKTAIVPHIVP
jgi:hypothetical protein